MQSFPNVSISIKADSLQTFSLQPKSNIINSYIRLPQKITYGDELIFMQKVYFDQSPWENIGKVNFFSERGYLRVDTTVGKNYNKKLKLKFQNELFDIINNKKSEKIRH